MIEVPGNTPDDESLFDEGNVSSDVLARLARADQYVEESNRQMSRLTAQTQASLLSYINSGKTSDSQMDILLKQTQDEIARGVFDTTSLIPQLKNILILNPEDKPQ